MTVNESQMAFGSFTVKLRGEEAEAPDGSPLPATPQSVLDKFDDDGFLGHIVITSQWIDPNEVDPLPVARYTGVLRETKFSLDGIELNGSGMVYWLGDQQQRGPIFENTLNLSSSTFAAGITAILPDAITPGNIIAEVGTQSASFLYVTARYALEYWCSLYSAEYEVTPQGTLNAGTPASLYSTFNNPTTFIKRHGAGSDPSFKHLPLANASFGADAVNFATRVISLTQVEETSFLEGAADLSPPTAKRDIHGNLVAITDVNVETSTLAVNADARAAARLAQIGEPRQVITMSTEDYHVDGTAKVGDSVYVWDPESALVDFDNEVEYRGEIYWPAKLRVRGLTWPITPEMGVYYRANDAAGTITDLTPYVEFETGSSTQLEVGHFGRSLIPERTEPLGPIVAPEINPNAAPSQPSAPSVSATDQILHILVSHDLTKAAGGSLESWTAFLKVFASTTSGFTPGPTNYIGRIEVTEAQITLGTAVVGVFELDNATEHFFKVQPVGNNGLEGPASAQASTSANLIPSAAIINLVADKITAGTITASIKMTAAHIVGALVETADSDSGNLQRVALDGLDPDQLKFYSGDASESSPGIMFSFIGGSGSSRTLSLQASSPRFTGSAARGFLDLYSRQQSGTGEATGTVSAQDALGATRGILFASESRAIVQFTPNDNFLVVDSADIKAVIGGTSRAIIDSSGASFLPDGTESFLIQNFQVVCREAFKMTNNRIWGNGSGSSWIQNLSGDSWKIQSIGEYLLTSSVRDSMVRPQGNKVSAQNNAGTAFHGMLANGFEHSAPPTITGDGAGNAGLYNLLNALDAMGLINNSVT